MCKKVSCDACQEGVTNIVGQKKQYALVQADMKVSRLDSRPSMLGSGFLSDAKNCSYLFALCQSIEGDEASLRMQKVYCFFRPGLVVTCFLSFLLQRQLPYATRDSTRLKVKRVAIQDANPPISVGFDSFDSLNL